MSRTQTEGGERFLSYEGLIREADRINQFIVACRSQREYRDADRADAIIGNLNRFTKALRLNNYSDHRFGFAITDREFLESVRPQIAIPELLQSQEFLRKVSAPNNYAAANAMIEDHNRTLSPERRWIVLLYKSRFLPTPDRAATFGRFFVFVRDGVYDKWIQFGIRTPDQPGQEERINNVSIVSVGPPDADNKRLVIPIDFWRTYEPDGSITLKTRYESINSTENCVACHKTAPLGIRPREEYMFDANGRLVPNTVNPGAIASMLRAKIDDEYGTPTYGAWLDPGAYGPSIGPAGRPRDPAFLRACAGDAGLGDTGLQNVRRAMKCDTCHNEASLGPLNLPQALKAPLDTSTSRQLREYVSQGWMPPNNTLTPAERAALYRCLLDEYYSVSTGTGLLVEWLKQAR